MAVAIAALCGAADVSAGETLPMTRPDPSWGAVAIVVVELEPSAVTAPGYYCPPSDPAKPDSICLGSTMFLQRGVIRRVIAATPDFGAARAGQFKTIGGHARRRIGGGRTLALVERTREGHGWVPWQAAIVGRRLCVPVVVLQRFAVPLPAALPDDPQDARCFDAGAGRT